MTRTFIEVPLFSKRWKEIGLGEDELRALQIMLLKGSCVRTYNGRNWWNSQGQISSPK